jgi:hypothetical protein
MFTRSIIAGGCVTCAWVALFTVVLAYNPEGERGPATGLLVSVTIGLALLGTRRRLLTALRESYGLNVANPRWDGEPGLDPSALDALGRIDMRLRGQDPSP